MDDGPRPDLLEEASRLLGAAAERKLPLRLIGGIAVALHAADGLHPAVSREYKDIDLATLKGKSRDATALLRDAGYVPNQEFNALSGNRLLFYDQVNARQVDIFVGAFQMCHTIPITERIEVDPFTIPLAELLLTKMQIVELNEKDQRDILALLHHHEVGDIDEETINAAYIAKLCAADWGLWRTLKMNVERIRAAIPSYGFTPEERADVERRVTALWDRVEAEPKSTKWKLRDRVGDRKKWYEEPEEVDPG
jgi:hypothetical protein